MPCQLFFQQVRASLHRDGASYLVTRGEIALVACGGGAPRSRHRRVDQPVSRCAARSARRVRSNTGSERVKYGLRVGESLDLWSVGNTEQECRTIAEQVAGVVQESMSVTRGHYYHAMRNCWRPLLDHLLQQHAAATSRPQALGKRALETRRFHVVPGTCLSAAAIGLRRDGRQSSGPDARGHCWHTGMSSDRAALSGPCLPLPLFLWLLDLRVAGLCCLSRQ